MKSIKISDSEWLNTEAIESWETHSIDPYQVRLESLGYGRHHTVHLPPGTKTVLNIRTTRGREITLVGDAADEALINLSS